MDQQVPSLWGPQEEMGEVKEVDRVTGPFPPGLSICCVKSWAEVQEYWRGP